jgi:hypothetical protein
LADRLGLKGSHLSQSAQMPLGLAELGCEKCIDQVLGHSGSYGPSAHADDVHVVVLNSLLGGEVIVNQPGADPGNLVRADRGTDPAPADREAALYLSGSDRAGERYNEVRIIITRIHFVRSKVDHVVPRLAKMSNQFLLQTKSTVISRNSNAHLRLLFFCSLSAKGAWQPVLRVFRTDQLFCCWQIG